MAEDGEIDKDLEDFIHEFEKGIGRIRKIAPRMDNSPKLREKANIFYQAYYARQLNKSTKFLFYATLILALSSGLYTMTILFGKEETLGIVERAIQVIIAIFITMIILAFLAEFFFSVIRKIKHSGKTGTN